MQRKILVSTLAVAFAAVVGFSAKITLAADDHEVIEHAMKTFHKAPEGTDPTCKKIINGTASDTDLADIIKAYQAMCGSKPPKGEVGPWQEKCKALVAAVKSIQAKDATGVATYKAAVNCKACHKDHKPD